MRNPERIKTVLTEIERIWSNNPDLRLCQLILNITAYPNSLYYVEDDTLVEALKQVYDK